MKIGSEIMDIAPEDVSMESPALFWAEEPDETFLESVRTFGIIEPLLVTAGGQGSREYSLVAGYKRLKAALRLGVSCPARYLEDPGTDDGQNIGAVYVMSNLSRLDQLEEGRLFVAFRWFAENLGRDRVESEVGALLGIAPGSKRARLFLDWLEMPEALIEAMVAGRLPSATASILKRMDAPEQVAVEPFFREWAWSRNNGVNFLTWVYEAARARNESVAALLAAPRYASALNAGLSPRDGVSRLCETARRDRYPTLTRLREEFAAAAKELKGGTSWKIEQPDNFETSGVELTIRIKDAEGLARAVKGLEEMAASSVWEKLWGAGNGS